jgi:hypothetical protein
MAKMTRVEAESKIDKMRTHALSILERTEFAGRANQSDTRFIEEMRNAIHYLSVDVAALEGLQIELIAKLEE